MAHEASRIDDLATRFFTAIEAGDVDTVASLYHPEAVIWHNNDQRKQSKAENLAVLRWLVTTVARTRYDIDERIVLPDGFVQQHVLLGDAPEVPAMMRPSWPRAVMCASGCHRGSVVHESTGRNRGRGHLMFIER